MGVVLLYSIYRDKKTTRRSNSTQEEVKRMSNQ
jgi:hypothetical protein